MCRFGAEAAQRGILHVHPHHARDARVSPSLHPEDAALQLEPGGADDHQGHDVLRRRLRAGGKLQQRHHRATLAHLDTEDRTRGLVVVRAGERREVDDPHRAIRVRQEGTHGARALAAVEQLRFDVIKKSSGCEVRQAIHAGRPGNGHATPICTSRRTRSPAFLAANSDVSTYPQARRRNERP